MINVVNTLIPDLTIADADVFVELVLSPDISANHQVFVDTLFEDMVASKNDKDAESVDIIFKFDLDDLLAYLISSTKGSTGAQCYVNKPQFDLVKIKLQELIGKIDALTFTNPPY